MTRNQAPPSGADIVSLSRRTWLKGMTMLAAGVATTGMSTAKPKSFRTRAIPRSGEQLPAVGLGTYRTFNVGAVSGQRPAIKAVLREFVALGGTVIDSSPMYGRSERVVGDLAAELRVADVLFYATKVWTSGRDAGMRQMKESMRRMRTARIDLMQIHNLVDWRTHLKTLYAWKDQGVFRYVGITHYTSSASGDMAAIMKREPLDFIQIPYNVVNRMVEQHLLPLAAERGIAVLVNEPFKQGALFHQVRGRPLPDWTADFGCASWAQFFLKYILGHPAVTCPIPATSKIKHLVDNMQAGFGRLPNASQRRRMVNYLKNL